jgi:hypothetical protein
LRQVVILCYLGINHHSPSDALRTSSRRSG